MIFFGSFPAFVERCYGSGMRRSRVCTRLPADDFVDLVERAGFPRENFTFDSGFAGLRRSAEQFGLNGLRPAVDWLSLNRPRQSTPVICHGDFQPFNFLPIMAA